MTLSRHLAVLGAVMVVGACGEVPTAAPPAAERASHSLRWAPGAGPRFAVASPTPEGIPNPEGIQAGPPAPELSTNQVSFWAYEGQDSEIQVNYLAGDGTWKPYVELKVPAGSLSQRPDGSAFAEGDSIEITLTLDTTEIKFELEPTGLQFDPEEPARLRIWYGGTNPDYNGDGILNFLDYLLEYLLGVYTRPTPSDPWVLLPSVQSLLFKRFTAYLEHFCGYAVEW